MKSFLIITLCCALLAFAVAEVDDEMYETVPSVKQPSPEEEQAAILSPNEPAAHDDDDAREVKVIPAAPLTPAVPAEPQTIEEIVMDWIMEISFGTLLFLMLALYVYGRSKNDEIAKAWYLSARQILGANFAQIGEGEGVIIRKESNTMYRSYMTGRDNLDGMLVTLDLVPRHNLLLFIWACLNGQKDTISYDMLSQPDSEAGKRIPALLFAIVHKKEKGLRKDDKALKRFTTLTPMPFDTKDADLAKTYSICVESVDVASVFAQDKKVREALKSLYPLVRVIMYTDMYTNWGFKQALTLKMELPLPKFKNSQENCERDIQAGLRFALHLNDTTLLTVTLSDSALKKSKTRLRKAELEVKKQEQKEREEKLQELKKAEEAKAVTDPVLVERLRKRDEKKMKKYMSPHVKMVKA